MNQVILLHSVWLRPPLDILDVWHHILWVLLWYLIHLRILFCLDIRIGWIVPRDRVLFLFFVVDRN